MERAGLLVTWVLAMGAYLLVCLSYISPVYLSLFIIYTATDFEHFISYKYRFSMTGIRDYL